MEEKTMIPVPSSDDQSPLKLRPLSEIYCELGHTLFALGKDLSESALAQKRFAAAAQAFEDAIRENPNSAELHLFLAQTREMQGRKEETLRAYLEAVRLAPSNAAEILPKAQQMFSRELAESLGDWLERSWRPAVETCDLDTMTRAAVHRFLGRASLYRGKYPRAVEHFQKAFSHNPHDPFILEGLGESLWKDGKMAEAAEILWKAVQQADQSDDASRRAATRLKLTKVLLDLQQYEQAITIIRQGLSLNQPQTIEFQLALSQCSLALGNTTLALDAAQQVLAQDKTRVEAHAVRAAALCETKQYEEAAAAAEAALELAPDNLMAIRIKAQALIDGKLDAEQAIRLLQFYLRQEPTDMPRHHLLIRALRENSRPAEEVAEAIQVAIESASPEQSPPLLLELAETYLQQASPRPEDAIATLEEAVRRDESLRSAQWWRLYGDAQKQAARFAEAIDSYQRGIELDRTNLLLLERYADLLTETDQLPVATRAWEDFIKLAPDDGDARLRQAKVLRRQNDLSGALAAVTTALTLSLDRQSKADAYELKAEILTTLAHPKEEIAEAYHEAGKQHYWSNNFPSAIRLFQQTSELHPAHHPNYWYWADALAIDSYTATPPYVDKEKIEESLDVWQRGAKISLPDKAYSWAYLSHAFINEQRARLPHANRWDLWWESVTNVEQALLWSGDANRWAALGRFYRYLSLEANALSVTQKALDFDPSNVAALEERGATLSNVGQFDEAVKVIDKRRELGANTWVDAVNVYILLRLQKWEKALEWINSVIQAMPEDFWYRDLRALCYLMMGQTERAMEDYHSIWSRYNTSNTTEQSTFGGAALRLNKVKEAIEIYSKLMNDPAEDAFSVRCSLGVCYLALNDQKRGEEFFDQALTVASNVRQLDDLVAFDLKIFEEEYLPKLPWYSFDPTNSGIIEEPIADQPPHAQMRETRETLNRVKEKIRQRRDEIAQETRTAETELQGEIAKQEQSGKQNSWAWVGAQAGLARLCVEERRWTQAIEIYQRLLHHFSDQFPEARLGLQNARVQLLNQHQSAGDRFLQEGDAGNAIEQFALAHRQALEFTPDDNIRLSELSGRMGYAHFELRDLTNARAHFTQALRPNPDASPGAGLGTVCRNLLRDATQYWALDDEWKAWSEESQTDDQLRHELMVARQSLATYLDDLFQLSSQAGETAQMVSAVTPIAVEIEDSLIPEDTGPDSLLFKTLLPEMRERLQNHTGVRIPGVRIRGDAGDLPSQTYVILLDEVPLVLGTTSNTKRYCPVLPDTLQSLGIPADDITETPHPLTGEPGCWVLPEHRDLIRARGLELWDEPLMFTLYHLEAVLRRNLADFLGVQEVDELLNSWGQTERGAALIQSALPDAAARLRFPQLLSALVKERVSIKSWEEILTAVQSVGLTRDEISHALRAVRLQLKPVLPGNQPSDERIELPADIEAIINKWIWHKHGKTFFALPPEDAQELLSEIRALVDATHRNLVLVTQSAEVRPFVRRLVELEFPDLMVIAQDELLPRETAPIKDGGPTNA